MLVSYPRSGSTWLRFLLSNVRDGKARRTTFENLNQRIPYALRPSTNVLKNLPRPRLLKSHSAYDCRFRKVLLLVRDPRDVAVSYYHYHLRRKRIRQNCTMDEYVQLFLQGELDTYGNWGEHTGSWLGARRSTEGFAIVRYEDLLENTHDTLRTLCHFVGGVPTDDATIHSAVENSGPHVMHPRKATPGEWREVLSERATERIEFAWKSVMSQLQYRTKETMAVQGWQAFV